MVESGYFRGHCETVLRNETGRIVYTRMANQSQYNKLRKTVKIKGVVYKIKWDKN